MPFVFLLIGLMLGSWVYSSLSEMAKEKHAEEACAYYQQQMKLENVPLQQGDTLQTPESILEYSREYMPLLHPKWEQIRSTYATTSASIKTMELRYAKLVELNKLNSSPIDTAKPKSYQAWLKHQNEVLEKSKRAHEQILTTIEKYYADAQIRGVDSDADLQNMVGGLVKAANIVLGDHGYEAALTPEVVAPKEEPKQEEAKQGTKQEPAKKSDSGKSEERESSTPRENSSKTADSKSEKSKNKQSKNNSSSKSSAKTAEIQAYMKLAKAYAEKISRAAELIDSICDPSSGRAADEELASLANELVELKKQCRSFQFKHVKDFDAEVGNPNSPIFNRIGSESGRIKNKLKLLRSTRGWVSGSTLSGFSNLLN